MQTRGRAKALASQSPSNPVNPLKGHGPRPPSSASEEEGDLGLATMLDEGAVSDVGRGSTSVSATSGPGDTTVVDTQVPISEVNVTTSEGQSEVEGTDPLLSTIDNTRLPVTCTQATIGSVQASISSFDRGDAPMQLSSFHPYGETRIPTLISEGSEGQAKLGDWPASTSAFSHVEAGRHDYCVSNVNNVNEMYWDENIDPYFARNVTCRPMRGAFHGSVPFTELPHGTDRSRSFRPIDRGYGRMSRDSSGSRDSRPKSRGSSRASSRASVANFEWIGDFMKKFAKDANVLEHVKRMNVDKRLIRSLNKVTEPWILCRI